MQKDTPNDHPIHAVISRRWSPRAFSGEPVTESQMQSLFEAARWAPSAFNEQPWRFIYAHRENEQDFEKLLNCLGEGNQQHIRWWWCPRHGFNGSVDYQPGNQ